MGQNEVPIGSHRYDIQCAGGRCGVAEILSINDKDFYNKKELQPLSLGFGSLFFRKLGRNNMAVSPVISTMLIMVIMLAMIMAIISWGQPTITNIETGVQHKATVEYMNRMDLRVEEIISMGQGASSPVELTAPGSGVVVASGSGGGGTSTQFTSRVEVFEETTRIRVSTLYNNNDVSFKDFTTNGFTLEIADANLPADVQLHVSVPDADVGEDDQWLELQRILDFSWDNDNKTYFCTLGNLTADLTGPFVNISLMDGGSRIADCYVYSIGSLSVDLVTPSETYNLHCINTMVTSNYPNQAHVENPPMLMCSPDGEGVTLYMVHMEPSGVAIGGPGTYRLNLTNRETGSIYKNDVTVLKIAAEGELAPSIYRAYRSRMESSLEGTAATLEIDNYEGLEYRFPQSSSGGSVVLVRSNIKVHLESL